MDQSSVLVLPLNVAISYDTFTVDSSLLSGFECFYQDHQDQDQTHKNCNHLQVNTFKFLPCSAIF